MKVTDYFTFCTYVFMDKKGGKEVRKKVGEERGMEGREGKKKERKKIRKGSRIVCGPVAAHNNILHHT
jgi:hypothetical protein